MLLRRALLRLGQVSVFQHARLEPFADQADDPLVTDPMFDEADQPCMTDRVEERPDTGVENPPDIASFDPVRERVQRICAGSAPDGTRS
ncbi:hypothetical protein CQ10_29505 [Bradyrhizobium valentinum]|nr:hypothetical protein CQ10_29505 [Bradyrhizobium valentinum]